jgi:hypothetical protein
MCIYRSNIYIYIFMYMYRYIICLHNNTYTCLGEPLKDAMWLVPDELGDVVGGGGGRYIHIYIVYMYNVYIYI